MTISAIILPNNKIAAVIVADATVDAIPPGYPEGSSFVVAPTGCDESWTYTEAEGFYNPNYSPPGKREF